jgi:tRNA (adenine22-N1)-methyltransferase
MSWKLPRGLVPPPPPPRVRGLGPRLAALYWRVPAGASVVDVGTDHGLLPWALVSSGRSLRAIGIDLHTAPRKKPRPGLIFLRGDGLEPVEGPVEVACFAGLGARTMAGIFARRAPRELGIRRVLAQPGAEEAEVRTLLASHGYALAEELFVAEGPRFFRVMVADASDGPVRLDEETRLLGHVSSRQGPLHDAWVRLQRAHHAHHPEHPAAALLSRLP